MVDGHDGDFARIFEQLYDPAILIDPELGRIIAANEAAQSLLGYGQDEFAKLTPSDIHPHEIPRLELFINTVLEKGWWTSDDLSCRTKNGATVPAQIRATSVHVFGRTCILALVHNRRTDKLAELGQAMRKVMHDLRSSLASSQILSDGLLTHDDPRVQRCAESIIQSIERTLRLCEQTLKVGHAGELSPNRTGFLLTKVIEEVGIAVGSMDGGIEVADHSASPIELSADYDQVFRILLNLVRNAQTAGAGSIELTGRSTDAEVTVDVADNGPGLPEAVETRLVNGHWDVARSGTSGLGLQIARELAENNNGDLALVSTGKTGTVFRLTLPRS